MKGAAQAVIETERLVLRDMSPGDVGSLAEVYCDARAMRFYPRPYTLQEVTDRVLQVRAQYASFGHSLYTVVLKSNGEVIGDCGPTVQEVESASEIEVGYHFLPRFWGHGYATEAVRGARDWAFTHLNCDRVISLVRPINVPSQRVASRNGMNIAKRILWRELEHDIWAIGRTGRQMGRAALAPERAHG